MTTVRAPRVRAAGLLTAITMTALLAACSTGNGASDAGAGTEAADSSQGSPSGESGGAGDGGDTGSAAESPASARELGDQATSRGPATPELERSVISSGTISLTSKDVAETRREVQRVVDAQGGEITEETTDTDADGDTSYSRLVVRVPSSKFGTAMVALEDAGVLRSSSRGSDDVTTEVIDTGVRVRAQEASLKRVELLLAEARGLKDIIWIESQLTTRQAELDSLKSQQSWLADQTSMSTITVDISTQPEVVEDEPDDRDEPAGFLAGLKGGTKALESVLAAVTTIIGALLPFVVVGLVLGFPVWLLVRRRRTAPATTPPAS